MDQFASVSNALFLEKLNVPPKEGTITNIALNLTVSSQHQTTMPAYALGPLLVLMLTAFPLSSNFSRFWSIFEDWLYCCVASRSQRRTSAWLEPFMYPVTGRTSESSGRRATSSSHPTMLSRKILPPNFGLQEWEWVDKILFKDGTFYLDFLPIRFSTWKTPRMTLVVFTSTKDSHWTTWVESHCTMCQAQ